MSEITHDIIEDLRDGRNKSSEYQIDLGEPLDVGGREGSKHIATISILRPGESHEEHKEIKLFAKELSSKEHVAHCIEANNFLKRSGFLVPSTMRYLFKEGKHYLLSTDMTEGGKYTLWGFSGGNTDSQTNDLDNMLLSESDLVDIKKRVMAEAEKADGLGVVIYANMYHIRNEVASKRLEICFLEADRYVLSDNQDFSNKEQAEIFLAKLRQELKHIQQIKEQPL